MNRKVVVCCALLLCGPGCVQAPPPSPAPRSALGLTAPPIPLVDHHKHLMSPTAAALASVTPKPAVVVPEELSQLLRARVAGWNDSLALAALYADSAMVFDPRRPEWIRGRRAAAAAVATGFARPYTMTPVGYQIGVGAGWVAGYYTRGTGEGARHFGHFHLSLERSAGDAWRIAVETTTFPGPTPIEPVPAERLIAELDSAGIRRAVVLSVAYWYARPGRNLANEHAAVRRENDWVAKEVARFPDRLTAFCSVNPLSTYAIEEIERCADQLHMKGLKLHFGNSGVDVLNPEHVAKVQQVFRVANARRLPIVVHLWVVGAYGRDQAEAFLNRILPEAPDVVVQIAHFAGGGPGYTDAALAVYADAVAAGDPRTKNLYFDVTTVADQQPDTVRKAFASRIRQIGLDRVLFGSDLALPGGNPPVRRSWEIFRTTVPLTDEEIRRIAANVAPYLR